MNRLRTTAKQFGVPAPRLPLEEEFFEPYDDSDRLYFRRELFGR